MAFVPEGQQDSSQARSAWTHQKNSLVPAGRLNGSALRLACIFRRNMHPEGRNRPAAAELFEANAAKW
jgi:hypothetical protein